MAQTGDDCYFYYYSTCAKGDTCPFRHQPAARGCEITCNLWEKGRCFKKACTFRHMVIEKDRSTIPCVWESQPSGCMKPYCPFLHTKPRNPTTQSIPTLGAPGHPGSVGRAGPGPRPPMYNNPPRPQGMPPNRPPYMAGPQPMQQRPMGYEGFIPHSRPSHPMMYQMHHNSQSHMTQLPYPGMMMPNMMVNHPRDYLMPPRPSDDYDDSDDDYTSSDYSDVSISDDERRGRSRESSRRRVQSPRHASSRREVRQRSDRDKRTESRSSRESYNDRKSTRRRHDNDKDRNKKDSERTRTKPRKDSENKDSGSSERKKSESSDEKPKSETEEKKSDIKIKTLEEILREKALKNLHERTALKKKAQMEADKVKKEGSDDPPEPILKSVVSVSKAEATSSQKVSESRDSDPEVEFVREKRARSPKTIILDIIDPDNEASSKTLRQVKVKEEEKDAKTAEKEEELPEEKDLKPPPCLTNIKVKTFEEIMEEKRQRKAQESKETVEENQEQTTEPERTVIDTSNLSRKIRVVKKDENKKETNPAGKLIVKRKVQRIAKKGIASGGEVETKEKEDKKPEKKIPQKERPSNIVIKSFDEIMKEKRQRKQEQTTQHTTTTTTTTTTTQEITTTAATTVKRPTIIRNKPLSTTNPRTFKTRKLKVIGRQGASSSNKLSESVSEPASPSKSSSLSPTSPKTTDLASFPVSNSAPQSPTSPTDEATQPEVTSQKPVSPHSGNDSDDDDSWENEDLPDVPLETPTLEGPARLPGIPNDHSSVLIIPGKVVQPGSSVPPTKRPRSSLEELFGVPTDSTDSKPNEDDESDDEERNVSPPKKVKTNQETYEDIVQAVNDEMSKKDDFDIDLDEEIANLPDKHDDHGNDTFNEDDLLLELEEMINN